MAQAQPICKPTAIQTTAVQHLVTSVRLSESSEDGPWLSEEEIVRVIHLLHDPVLLGEFDGLVKVNDKRVLRTWVRSELALASVAKAAGAGASANAPEALGAL